MTENAMICPRCGASLPKAEGLLSLAFEGELTPDGWVVLPGPMDFLGKVAMSSMVLTSVRSVCPKCGKFVPLRRQDDGTYRIDG